MDLTVVEGLPALKLDLVITLAAAATALLTGQFLQRRLRLLARYSIPSPIVGGLLFALLALIFRAQNLFSINIDTTLRAPLQTIFFTTIGLGATLSLLRAGGWQLPFFLLIASLTAVVQNSVGVLTAVTLGAPPALGIICGSLTLTGGPATGLAFAGAFGQLGLAGADALIIASATFGIFAASIVGNPVATWLIKRFKLTTNEQAQQMNRPYVIEQGEANDDLSFGIIIRTLCLILVAMGLGAVVSLGLTRIEFPLPGYIGAMVIAALGRNLDDKYNKLRIDMKAVQLMGSTALAFFLVIALMDLKLWQLAGLAAPMLIILLVQVVATILYCVLVTFTLMGCDYEAAVMTSGHIGFGLGITPNAVANMKALTEKYAPAPRSFLVVPIVGASFIDFTNSLIITASLKALSYWN